ncbi:hypothetical protein HII31_10167 [Pseudocercospora fuligena]|uniref:Uncharacterized protein n=1 Tax=Pseudocercospora fuligena TaxID=685502 RepID=A0A8H6RAW9_9PEZI|nr:hypothetical protein HII31_10167 [Pseudocercospora fuligena]
MILAATSLHLVQRHWFTSLDKTTHTKEELYNPFLSNTTAQETYQTTPQLLPRAPKRSWQDSITFGKTLICAMQERIDPETGDTKIAKQSKWKWSDTSKYGWSLTLNRNALRTEFTRDSAHVMGLKPVMKELGISFDENNVKDWRVAGLSHQFETKEGQGDDYVVYPATTARYSGWYDLLQDQATIIARFSFSPDYMVGHKGIQLGGNKKLPPLQKWSDLTYLLWEKLSSGDGAAGSTGSAAAGKSNLKHVFQHHVVNKDTQNTIKRAKGGGSDEGVASWPGWTFEPGTEAFESVLSAPNAYGVAFMLSTHKAEGQLGLRMIDKIQAFNCPNQVGDMKLDQWCLYSHIAPVVE